MEFDSFEDALRTCMTAEDGSSEQDAAILYCLENAPPDLRDIMHERYRLYQQKKLGGGVADKSGS